MQGSVVLKSQVLSAEFSYVSVPLKLADELLAWLVPGHKGAFWQSAVFRQLWKDVVKQSSGLLAHALLPDVNMSTMSETSFSCSSYERPSSVPQASNSCARVII